MSMVVEIEKMTKIERLQAMELLWDLISKDDVSSPSWHKEILEQRRKRIESGETKFISLEQLKRHYQR